jgi:hypothetical protein
MWFSVCGLKYGFKPAVVSLVIPLFSASFAFAFALARLSVAEVS